MIAVAEIFSTRLSLANLYTQFARYHRRRYCHLHARHTRMHALLRRQLWHMADHVRQVVLVAYHFYQALFFALVLLQEVRDLSTNSEQRGSVQSGDGRGGC